MTRSRRAPPTAATRSLALAVIILGGSATRARAEAADAATCAAAANEGQPLRRAGKLRAARERFVTCASDGCPDFIRARCLPWLIELDEAIPSVVVRANDTRGHDVVDVRVSIDGEPISERAGAPVLVDPGTHQLRFVAPSGETQTSSIVIAQGEKNRLITAVFRAPPEPADEHLPPSSARRPLVSVPLALGIGAGGIVALGVFAFFETKSWNDYFGMRDGCAQTKSCAKSDLDALRNERLAAGISLAVGGLAVATSAFFLIVRPTTSAGKAVPSAGVLPIVGGGAAEAAWVF